MSRQAPLENEPKMRPPRQDGSRPVSDAPNEPVTTVPIASLEPLAVDAQQAAGLLGLSRSMFYKMVEAGKIGPAGRRFGNCVRYSVAELRAWVAQGMPPRHEWSTTQEDDGN